MVDGFCNLFEQKLKLENPNTNDFSYDVLAMFTYIDGLYDLGALLYNLNIKAYEPKGKEWVKEQIYRGLK